MAPRSRELPSPQSTWTFLTALPLAVAAVTTNVKFAGNPTFGGFVGGVITSVGATETLTWTVPDAVPEVVPVPPVPPVAPPVPCTPTVAVTVACTLVVREVRAAPSAPVFTTESARFPAVVVKNTGALGKRLPFVSATFAVSVVVPPIAGTGFGDAK